MLLAIYYCAAAVLLWCGLFRALNLMNRHSCHATRLAWLLVTTAALQILVSPVFGKVPAPALGDVLLLTAVACYFFANHSRGKP